MRGIVYFVVFTGLFGGVSPAHAAFSPDILTKAVSTFFTDAPVMVAIARCESALRQYDAAGQVLRGGYGNHMIGLFQLHETYHRAEALTRGYNIDTLLGNMAYARDLYRSEGTTPWLSSLHCWQESSQAQVAQTTVTGVPDATEGTRITKVLVYGMTDPEVKVLQQKLNQAGYRVTTGGEETPYFGIATFLALQRFQCDQNIACRTDPASLMRIGRVDAETRSALNTVSAVDSTLG